MYAIKVWISGAGFGPDYFINDEDQAKQDRHGHDLGTTLAEASRYDTAEQAIESWLAYQEKKGLHAAWRYRPVKVVRKGSK